MEEQGRLTISFQCVFVCLFFACFFCFLYFFFCLFRSFHAVATLKGIIHKSSTSSYSSFFWSVLSRLLEKLVSPDHIRSWLLTEMNHCTLPKTIVERFLSLFESDSEIVNVLKRMLSLYEVNQTSKKEPTNILQKALDALTVDKPRSKRAESFCQDIDWLSKKPHVLSQLEGVPVMETEEREELSRFAVSLTSYYSAGKSESLFRRLNPLTFLRLWRRNANSFYQNRQLFVYV